MAKALRKIRIVPHFMRLHEWIAEEEGYYALEGLDPVIEAQTMYKVVNWDQEKYMERPQDMPFVQDEAVCNSACQWAVPMNAAAGMGRVVPDVYSVARFALFVRPESGITRLSQLRDVPVAVGRMAGSHFAALETFEAATLSEWLLGDPARRTAGAVISQLENQRAVIENRFKLILDRTSGSAQLFDLAADPGEKRDLAGQRPLLRGRLVLLLSARPETAAPDLSPP